MARITLHDEPTEPKPEPKPPTQRPAKRDEPHLDLARRIVGGGNIVEHLDAWARRVTREERLQRALRDSKNKEQDTAEFWLSEGEAAYIEAAEEAGLKREDALKRYARREAF